MAGRSGSPSPGKGETIREEHERLKALLRDLEAVKELPALIPLLETLREMLAAHFATEEGPGGLESVVTEAQPQLADRLQEVLDEHRVLLEDLADILARGRECLERHLPAIFADVAGLAKRLHDHETKENELLTDAAYTELGGGA